MLTKDGHMLIVDCRAGKTDRSVVTLIPEFFDKFHDLEKKRYKASFRSVNGHVLNTNIEFYDAPLFFGDDFEGGLVIGCLPMHYDYFIRVFGGGDLVAVGAKEPSSHWISF
jgi:hypothetical protein